MISAAEAGSHDGKRHAQEIGMRILARHHPERGLAMQIERGCRADAQAVAERAP